MKQKHLKSIRLVFSIFFLVALAAIFLDFRESIPVSWVRRIHWLQFIPSVIDFTVTASVAASGFLIVLLLTLLFGRVYCSMLCPLGALQDIFTFLSRKLTIRKRFKYTVPKDLIRYGFLVLALVSLVFGSVLTLYLLDPYSNFGRIFADLGRPVVIRLNNILAGWLENLNWYFLYKIDYKGFEWKEAVFPLSMLAVLIWLSLFHGRLFCNTVCPAGTFLGLLSRFSFFRIRMDKVSCTKCGKCAVVCKSSCINVKEMVIDVSRCVDCYNCLKVCPSVSIGYKMTVAGKKPEKQDASKRAFLSKSVIFFLGLSGISRRIAAQGGTGDMPVPFQKNNSVSPPGSLSLAHFKSHCTACHLCVTACPSQVLQPSFLEYGFTGMLQPHLDFSVGFCEYECTKCGVVCPAGAILPLILEDKKLTQIGKVHFIMKNCVVYTDETSCGSCAEHCPTQAVRMVAYKNGLTIPETHTDICIGCGACEHVCPAKPYKAIYVDGNPVHQVARKPEIEKPPEIKSEEFPF
jgi:polyferredoxin